MSDPPKKKEAHIAVHGHFYQPPRESPWLEIIENEGSAYPFHDWNERIALECYRPNAYARIVDDQGRILEVVNNYSSIGFNFGPTLLPWLEKHFPSVYGRILQADREGLKRFGHGNAMAQVYNHVILPLASSRDKETEVLWGMADFEKRFHRKPDGMWLPETAANYETFQVLVKHGIRYVILSPFQASRTRPFGGRKWTDVSQGRVDTTQPYRCFIRSTSGKKLLDFIDIFFYNAVISREIAFGDLLSNGNTFCNRFLQFYQGSRGTPQLVHVATDGETYGHHKKFGDMALAYALHQGFDSRGIQITNHGAFLKRFPPVHEVEIDEGPKGEGSSWSCAHGVGRWKEDCGCSTGGQPGWNQKWRRPLREALNLLRDRLSQVFEQEGKHIFRDGWEARDGYIDVVLDRSHENLKKFFNRFGAPNLDEKSRIKGLKLLEMQRHALKMYTSCGWFFADLSGIETIIILQNASRAIQLAEELEGQGTEEKFLRDLSEAESNLAEMGRGDQIYRRFVKPKWVTAERVVNQYAVTSLFDGHEEKTKIFSYQVDKLRYERKGEEENALAIGEVRVTSNIISESKEFQFGLIPSSKDIFRTWVAEKKEGLGFDLLREKALESLGQGEEEMTKVLTSLLGNLIFTMRDTFEEGKQATFQKLIQREFDEHCQVYADLFDRTKQAVEALSRGGLEIPFEIRVAAEVTLSERLFQEINDLRKDFKTTVKRKKIDEIVQEAKAHGYQLRKAKSLFALNEILMERMKALRKAKDIDFSAHSESIEEIITLLDLAKKWGLEISLDEAQNVMGEILQECVENLEKCWWENGTPKMFSPALLPLAEKLGFNVERFSKTTGSAASTKPR